MDAKLASGTVISNDELCKIFLCSPQGGMRRSTRTNTLVLISNHVESIYEDKWIGDTLHYTGMGTEGDQSREYLQNKTLDESNKNGVEVHLFEVYHQKEYTYRGVVKLAADPYQSKQTDSTNQLRKVWIFPLKLVNDAAPIPEQDFNHAEQKRENVVKRVAKKLSDEDLSKRAQNESTTPGTIEVKSKRYQRNHYLVELVNRRANGVCQLCDQAAPFTRKDGTPYLEVHHIVALADGGADSLENTVALCPNCHRKMHALALKEDIQKLQAASSSTDHSTSISTS